MTDDLIDVEELMSDFSPAYVEAYLMERVSGQSIEGGQTKKKRKEKKFSLTRFPKNGLRRMGSTTSRSKKCGRQCPSVWPFVALSVTPSWLTGHERGGSRSSRHVFFLSILHSSANLET